jgi:hypothetical protein
MENSKENRKGKRESKLARVPSGGCHPLSSKFIWRQPKEETTPIT